MRAVFFCFSRTGGHVFPRQSSLTVSPSDANSFRLESVGPPLNLRRLRVWFVPSPHSIFSFVFCWVAPSSTGVSPWEV
jgi:hypothetical protein